MEETTDSLRELAQRWSLAGDEKLLKILQSTHKKIVTKCGEVNSKLNDMTSALHNASINLHNVNNKFMALSNSQFIESRVYDDDDADVGAETKPPEEPTKPDVLDELTLLKKSLVVLDNAHETTVILDESDSDDSDAEISIILKHKDIYSHRPLPFIIGSSAWKHKWHAGLVIDYSESDSETSKLDERETEQFSDSEEDIQTDKHLFDASISEHSSSLHSEREKDHLIPEKQTPAAIAAELAAKLGNAPPRMLEESEDSSPLPTSKTVYRPQKPVSSTIFSDEPPPLDLRVDHSSSQEEDDIFAEINKKQPYANSNTAHNITDDLFGNVVREMDFNKESEVKQKSTLFEDESEPEMFVEKPTKNTRKESTPIKKEIEDTNTKKPVGGISLFGSNKGTESIGAAILNRNRRKSFSSDNESDDNTNNTIKNDTDNDYNEEDDNVHNANYIFDNLFAKAKQAEQKTAKPAKIDRPVKEKPKTTAKEVKDLFSDNIFDDIDDIFTSNIKMPTKEDKKNAKSIFDDDDDLFSDIAKKPAEVTNHAKASSNSNKKSIFDSDDDLFSVTKETKNSSKNHKKKIKTSEADPQMNKPLSTKTNNETNNNSTNPELVKTQLFDDSPKIVDENSSKVQPKAKSKSIFDSDSDDLFSEVQIKTSKPQKVPESTKDSLDETKSDTKEKNTKMPVTDVLKTEKAKVFQSPSLFEEDEIDDLFINANKVKLPEAEPENTINEYEIPENIPDLINKLEEKTSSGSEDDWKEDVKSKIDEKDIPIEVKNKKPVIADTKPLVIPKMKETELTPDKLFDDEEDNIFAIDKDIVNSKITPEKIKDDFIETSQNDTNVQSSSNYIGIESESQEPISKNNDNAKTKNVVFEAHEPFVENNINLTKDKLNEPLFDEVPVKEKQDVFPEQKIPVSVAAFDDLFSQPPAFEKTKETKKVANVNALFEDDSDDEALFFKKSDVISDEKPEIFSPSANFALFNDEPPAFLDFATKTTKNDDDDDDLFSSVPKKEPNTSNEIKTNPPEMDEWNDDFEDQPIKQVDDDINLFSSPEVPKPVIKALKPKTKVPSKEIPDSDEELFTNIPKTVHESGQKEKPELAKESKGQLDNIKPKDIKTAIDADKDKDTKKIGKLNTKNFNINVQALVPGASPKKILKERSNENINKEDNTNKVTEELEKMTEKDIYLNKEDNTKEIKSPLKVNEVSKTEVDTAEPIVKSISFEDKPEAGVLDNNLSKQRAKIQIKRRPSSRRARHEAVRKSVIDLDDDTDNSSSFDEPLPKNKNNIPKPTKENKILDNIANEQDKDILVHKAKEYEPKNVEKDDNIYEKSNNKGIFNIHDEITKSKSIESVKSIDEIDAKSKYEEGIRKEGTQNVINDKTQHEENKSPQSTTKVVYILNDEDIFSNNTDKQPKHNIDKDDIDELFKNDDDDAIDDLFKNKGIKTIGNTYKETNINKETKKHAEPEPSKEKNIEAIKEPSKNVQPKSTKSLFDENKIKKHAELEQSKHENEAIKEPSKNVQPKAKSLFDLSDDDEDLFGNNTKSKKVEVKTKLFESDSEDDLFSGKKKVKKEATKNIKEDKNNKEDKNVKEGKKVKGSLFGDDDDDDLFGVKTKIISESTKASTSKSKSAPKDSTKSGSKDSSKQTEIVFEDPLSMLDDD